MKRIWFLFTSVIVLWSTCVYPESYAVVTLSPDLPHLKTSQVKMLYRGRLNHIENNNISLLDMPQGSTLRERFYYDLLGKSPAQMQAIWARQTFSGRTKAPYEAKHDNMEEVLIWLSHNKNGIAYVPVSWVNERVNVLYAFDSEEPL